MGTANRLPVVRFRDLLPASTQDHEGSVGISARDEEPLFSPSFQQPQLLHTIFSPPSKERMSGENGWGRGIFHPQRLELTTQSTQRSRNDLLQPQERRSLLEITNRRSLPSQSKLDTTNAIERPKSSTPLSPSRHNVTTVYLSPSQSALSSLAASMDADLMSGGPSQSSKTVPSATKTVTSRSTTAFRTLEQLEWLSVDFITSCTFASQLLKIITVLKSCQQYPTLLRLAQQRLHTLRAGHSVDADTNADDVANTNKDVTEEDSSLIMSISTTDPNNDLTDEHQSRQGVSMSYLSAPSVALSSDSLNIAARNSSATEKHLRRQVQSLLGTIAEMGNHPTKQCSMIRDQSSGMTTSGTYRDTSYLLHTIQQLNEQNCLIRQQIENQSAAYDKDIQDCTAAKQTLVAELRTLEQRLSVASSVATKEAKQRFEQELQAIRHLCSATQSKLQGIKNDRDDMVYALQLALNRKKTIIESKEDRDRLLADFREQTVSRQQAFDSLKKRLQETERAKRTALDAQRKSEGLVIESTSIRRRAERENLGLLQQVQRLSDELHSSRIQLEQTICTSQLKQNSATKEREQRYLHIIQEMKEEMRKQENAVPISVYKSAVSDARRFAAESKNQKLVVELLKTKVVQLEKSNQRSKKFNQNPSESMLPKGVGKGSPLERHDNFSASGANISGPNIQSEIHSSDTPSQGERVTTPQHLENAARFEHHESFPTETIAKSLPQNQTTTPVLKPALKKATVTRDPTQKNVAFDATSPNTPSRLPDKEMTTPGRQDYRKHSLHGQSKTPSRLEFSLSPTLHNNRSTGNIRVSMVRQVGGRKGLHNKLREMRSKVGPQVYQKKLEQMNISVRPKPLQVKN